MNVVFATSEISPWVKTGGLGDVAGALPAALVAQGVDVRILVPAYPALRQAFPAAHEIAQLHGLGGLLPGCRLLEARSPDGVVLWLLDYAPYFDRAGNPYLGPEGRDWLDNHLRFGLLSRVAAWLGSAASTLDWKPDVVHCNDWQTGLAPAYLELLPEGQAHSVITVHNLAFQGVFGSSTLPELGLPDAAWHMHGVEYHGYLSFLKAGLQHAQYITTVSPSYAREIQTDAEGMGMAGLLRHRADRLSGILNGIDTTVWNPATDPHLAHPYDVRRTSGKKAGKAALQAEFGLAVRSDLPLFGVVSRLTHQKGLDLIVDIADALVGLPAQLAVLGSGDAGFEQAFRTLAQRHAGQVAVTIGFNEGLAHRIEAGADMFLMPSRFEPCGLNQMYSLRYGTPPIVRATGGLADTVIDASDAAHGNGFVFTEATALELLSTVRRAAAAWQDKPAFTALRRRAMKADFSWAEPAAAYARLYASL